MKTNHQISQKEFCPGGGFMGTYQRLVKNTVIPYQYQVLCDQVEGVEKSHVIQNFINAGKSLRGEALTDGFYGMVFQDSDAAKWIEAVAYSLQLFPDKELEQTADQLIEQIAAAQDSDGYLNTYYTIKDRDRRWQNLLEGHELYCSGHMMEAACAYFEATGKTTLLHVMERNMEHIYQRFVVNKVEGFPGHPEVELALMKLYRKTNNAHCLELAEHFINKRGVDPLYYEKEAAKRDWNVWGMNPKDHTYMQNAAPVREQSEAVGHAVRAVYLYTGMADLASEINDVKLFQACERLWNNIVDKKLYLTGGIGATVLGEAFSVNYDLPGDTAYAETCASIGLVFFASRMLEHTVDSKYSDVMEQALYNTVLAGMQLDGKKFFYVNPLEVVPGISGIAPTKRHDLPVRPNWYTCACCPPNVARMLSSLGIYAYSENESTAFCHLYVDGSIHFENGLGLTCTTGYPYDFTIHYKVTQSSGTLAIRIPHWSPTYTLLKNQTMFTAAPNNGYVYLSVAEGDEISLVLNDKPYYVYASQKVPNLNGCTAICRGPLVYCFEGVDNGDDVLSLRIKKEGALTVSKYQPNLLNGTVTISAEAIRIQDTDSLYSLTAPTETPCNATAVPYYTWGNRGENQMRVWMNLIS